jgi:Sulfite exporter TauE/SafE.
LGAYITSLISADQLKTGFGIYSILIALNVIVSTWIKSSSNKKQHRTINKIKGSFYGLFAGLITGVFGTSGTAPILAGLFTMNISVKTVIGTSLFVVLVNTLFAIGGHLFVGKLDLTLVGFLSIGSIIGALVGPFWVSKAKTDNSESKIKYIYALVIVAIGVIMIMD